ncbi:hypothetical protein ACHAPW_000985 [Verticillium nonalfalfae]
MTEWLFKRVAAVVHHGGAGTTACGLVNGIPTTIVPFFGDQPFWGGVIASNRAGPPPISYRALSVERLTGAIQYCLSPEAQNAAEAIAGKMRQEFGVRRAVELFQQQLPLDDMRCDVLHGEVARWRYQHKGEKVKAATDILKISDAALAALLRSKKLKMSDVKPYRPKEYIVDNKRWDPLTAGASSVLGTITDFTTALGGTFIDPFREMKRVRGDESENSSVGSTAAAAAGRGVKGMTTSLVKGTLVDVPLALTEGLKAVPRLYGDSVTDHGPVTDWKSGGVVAAKNFGSGFYAGITGVVTKPLEGAKKEGAFGFFKGVGKGSMGLVTRPGSVQTLGYGGRIMSHFDEEAIGPFVVQSMLILVAPALFAASIYMILGRIIQALHAEHLSLIPVKWLTKIFVIGDIVSFVLQAGGGGIQAVGTLELYELGEKIIIVGLFVQIVIFSVFMIVTITFHTRLSAAPTPSAVVNTISWRRHLYVLYTTSLLILVRSAFRVVEYLQGNGGYLISHEIWIYIFDAVLMALAMAILAVWYVGDLEQRNVVYEEPVAISSSTADINEHFYSRQPIELKSLV